MKKKPDCAKMQQKLQLFHKKMVWTLINGKLPSHNKDHRDKKYF